MKANLRKSWLLLLWTIATMSQAWSQVYVNVVRTLPGKATEYKRVLRDPALYPNTPNGTAAFLRDIRQNKLALVDRPPVSVNTEVCSNSSEQCTGNSSEVRTFTMQVPTAGSYPLRISYRATEGAVVGNMRVNGGTIQTVSFPQNSSYQVRTTANVNLVAGTNTILLSSSVIPGGGNGYFCVNQVCATVSGQPGQVVTTPPPASSYPNFARSLVIGNSITMHGGTDAFIVTGPSNRRGMAATSPEKDFVHLLGAKLAIGNPANDHRSLGTFDLGGTMDMATGPFMEGRLTGPSNEFYQELTPRFNVVTQFAPQILYMRLGENVNDDAINTIGQGEFQARYKALIDKVVSGNPSCVVILSTSVWGKPNFDIAMRAIAAQRNYPLADFTGMWANRQTNGFYAITGGPNNGGQYNDGGVNNHPDDDGMQHIADKLWAVTPGASGSVAGGGGGTPTPGGTGVGGTPDNFAYQPFAESSQSDPFPVFETDQIKVVLALRTQRPGTDTEPGLGGTVYSIYNKAEPGYNLLFNPRYRPTGGGGALPGEPFQIGSAQGFSMCLYQNPLPYFATGETGVMPRLDGHPQGKLGDPFLGFNPNEGGDDFRNTGKLLNYGRSGNSWYKKVNPPIYGQIRKYTDVVRFETWGEVAGRALRMHYRAVFNRTEGTDPGKQLLLRGGQEMPCLYVNGHKSTIVWYDGNNPYSGEGTRQYNYGAERLNGIKRENLMVTEPWVAAIDPTTGLGVGLILNQGRAQTGYFCGPQSGPGRIDWIDPSGDNTYIGNNPTDILDDQMDYRNAVDLVVGTVAEIRAYAYQHSFRMKSKPEYRFNSQSRHGWSFNPGSFIYDSGILEKHTSDDGSAAITNGWKLYANSGNAKIYSPASAYKASEFNKIYINMEAHGMSRMRFNWRRNKQTREHDTGLTAEEQYTWPEGKADKESQFVSFPVFDDGRTETYVIDMAGKSEWKNIITELMLNLDMENAQPSDWVKINWISTSPGGPPN